jgi:hypothetical protein
MEHSMSCKLLLTVLAVIILMPPAKYEPAQTYYVAGHGTNESRDEFGIKAD